MESIFLSAIDMYGHQFCPENLKVRLPPSVHLPQSTVARVGPPGDGRPMPSVRRLLGSAHSCKYQRVSPVWPGLPRGASGSLWERSSPAGGTEHQAARLPREVPF